MAQKAIKCSHYEKNVMLYQGVKYKTVMNATIFLIIFISVVVIGITALIIQITKDMRASDKLISETKNYSKMNCIRYVKV